MSVRSHTMLEQTKLRALPLLNKTGELAPAATACCGACRTCVTTNVFAAATALVAGLVGYARRALDRNLG